MIEGRAMVRAAAPHSRQRALPPSAGPKPSSSRQEKRALRRRSAATALPGLPDLPQGAQGIEKACSIRPIRVSTIAASKCTSVVPRPLELGTGIFEH
jgi:hypothetical protein